MHVIIRDESVSATSTPFDGFAWSGRADDVSAGTVAPQTATCARAAGQDCVYGGPTLGRRSSPSNLMLPVRGRLVYSQFPIPISRSRYEGRLRFSMCSSASAPLPDI
ncbi:hypothetical protein NDU88_002593 [Pleurodeles waltl]|uniref:Uncharacterized protein n=1 Tax=Pleurodeles waltl TaxID=8319 RepID=A0AAV7MXW4_PLEWA|nr:hypothetical protein NDU88_002593 [Pleurodeles waltl]